MKDNNNFITPYLVEVAFYVEGLGRRIPEYLEIYLVKDGKDVTINNPTLKFEVDTPKTQREIKVMFKGTVHPILGIKANYTFPDHCLFPGIDNIYLPFVNAEIRPGRCVGNTTRCVDAAVQMLFDKGKVLLVDHYENGSHKLANGDFRLKVFDRLRYMRIKVLGVLDAKPSNTYYVEFSGTRNAFGGTWIKLMNYKLLSQ